MKVAIIGGGPAGLYSAILLKKQRPQFDADLHDSIDKLLQLAQPFRLDANSKVHNIIEYLDSPSQLKKMKIPEMAQLLLRMIDRVK